MAMFGRAEHVNVYGGSFVANAGSPSNSLDKLAANVAPHAILNAGGRADDVRCFPGTREEVIGRLEAFMDDNSPGRKRMLWLSGPAGAGKSAIFQTVAERRSEQAANFFFFRGDSTRSHSKPLVATLVYQLRRLCPALDVLLSDYLAKDPLIFNASIEKQFKQLISSPVQTIRQSTPIQQPIVIIIDGLDECNDETRDQDQILAALHRFAHADDSPFLILVSSRAEPQLIMSFNRLGDSLQSIFLNNDYKPQEDIRLFVVAKFTEIKKDHYLASTLSKEWPPDADINAIVHKSSSQFIYSATVMRYIQYSSESPAISLVTILETRPSVNHNPLAHLDAVYSHIFSKVHNIRAVKRILLARKYSKSKVASTTGMVLGGMFGDFLRLMGYEDIHVQSFFGDLAAIIKVVPGDASGLLVFYHASLEDYLGDKSRSTVYYVNENETAAELSSMCLRNIHNTHSIWLIVMALQSVQEPTTELSKSLLDTSTRCLSGSRQVPYLEDLIHHIERLYWKQDTAHFKVLLQRWSHFVCINNVDHSSHDAVRAKDPLASQYYKEYWMTKGYDGQEPLIPPDSAPAGVAKSDVQIPSAKVSRNMAIGGPVCSASVHMPGAFPQNNSYTNDNIGTRVAEQRGMVAGLARSYAFLSLIYELFVTFVFIVKPDQPGGTSHRTNTLEQEEEE